MTDREGADAGFWPLVTQGLPVAAPGGGASEALLGWCRRLAALESPVLAEYVLADASAALGIPLVDGDAVARSRLLHRFRLAHQRRWAEEIAAAGIEVVYLKGFANGHALYPDPVLRVQGDLDLLVRECDLERLVAMLAGNGFRFVASARHRWGMISDASFLPLVSADGACDIDIHIHPDCYPAHRSLTTGRVFAAACRIEAGGRSFLVPCAEHIMALCATNACKDKLDMFALRKAIDAVVMLRRGMPLDWEEIARLARDGRWLKPARAFFALLHRLGAPPGAIPDALLVPPRGLATSAFERVVADFRELFVTRPSMIELLWREAVLCAEPGVAAHNIWLRLSGLVRPHRGVPAGAAALTAG